MWVIAGVLLGLVVLASLIGFHIGPHAHVAAGVLGVLAAVWLIVMALEGQSAPVLWALLSADIVVSAGIGTLAWKALSTPETSVTGRHLVSAAGAEGVALEDLDPEGIVRVNGEDWSAVALNATVRAGTPVHVLRSAGVRLEVWGEDSLGEPGGKFDFSLPGDPSLEKAEAKPDEPTNEGGRS